MRTAELEEGMEEVEVDVKETISSTLDKAEFNSSFKVSKNLKGRERNSTFNALVSLERGMEVPTLMNRLFI